MRERWKRAAETLAHAGARVTERAFNCKLDRVAALQRTHKMLWFALSAYLKPNKKRYKSMACQSFNIIHVIRLAFSHARNAYLGAAAFLTPLRFAAAPRKCNDPNTHPRLKIFGEPT